MTTCATDCPHTHSAEEAADLVGGVSALTLRRKAGRRQIPSTRVGREIRFTDDHITQIIRGGERHSTPPRRDSRRRS